MMIVKRVEEIQQQYAGDIRVQRNGTKLLGTPPKHYVFAPMPPEIQKQLTDSYCGEIPKELLQLYEAANGFALFLTARKIGKYSVPMACLNVYGVPTDANTVDALQPYHIRVEDLGRPGKTPNSWLKFGSYHEMNAERRLFVDTIDHHVYAVDADAAVCIAQAQWDSIDQCLCDLVDRLRNP